MGADYAAVVMDVRKDITKSEGNVCVHIKISGLNQRVLILCLLK